MLKKYIPVESSQVKGQQCQFIRYRYTYLEAYRVSRIDWLSAALPPLLLTRPAFTHIVANVSRRATNIEIDREAVSIMSGCWSCMKHGNFEETRLALPGAR